MFEQDFCLQEEGLLLPFISIHFGLKRVFPGGYSFGCVALPMDQEFWGPHPLTKPPVAFSHSPACSNDFLGELLLEWLMFYLNFVPGLAAALDCFSSKGCCWQVLHFPKGSVLSIVDQFVFGREVQSSAKKVD